MQPDKNFTPGDRYHDFMVTKSMPIPELHCHLIELVHTPSGAEVLHIANADPENFFCLSFRTLPESSNGVAHVLEHTVLCGSKKYPVKDPFFSMNRRSLNTFMNALTGADFTCYPAASQVQQDFYNLLDVYIDAVFHPTLSPTSFSQEGYRLEFASPTDPKTALQFKGVVFNEMKGALSSSSSRLVEAVNAALFPDTPYGHNFGGDPEKIPNLTYEELISFHKNFYHPSRCLFFFSGNFPLEKHLDFIAEHALKNVSPLAPLAPIPKQPRFLKPVSQELSYPIAADETTEEKAIICFAWLTMSILNQIEVLLLSILDIILVDTDASVLKKELLRSGLCKQALSLSDSEIAEIPYGIIVKGCNEKDAKEIESLLFSCLNKLVHEGVDPHLIDTALHQLELHRSEITGDSAPFGLSLFSRSALLKQHGGNAEDGLRIHSLFEELRACFKENPRFLSEFILKWFINNKHYVRVVLKPDQNLAQAETAKELERLEIIRKALSDSDVQRIINNAEKLKALQESEDQQELDILPKIHLKDVPKQSRAIELTHTRLENLELFHTPAFTNNITYATMAFAVPETTENNLWLLRLFSILLPQVGSGLHSYDETLERIQEHTGGIVSYLSINHQAQDAKIFSPTFHVRGKSMYHKSAKLFEILFDMICSPNFTDRVRIKELILKHYTNLQASFVPNSLKYAMNLSASTINVAGKILHAWYGLEYFYKIKALAKNIDEEIDDLIMQLEQMREHLLSMKGPHLIIGCDKSQFTKYIESGFEGLEDLPYKPSSPWKGKYTLEKTAPQGRIIASPVANTCMICESVSYTHPATPALGLAAFLFDNLTLHKRVREAGGAYGAGSVSSAMSASFSLYSYRDPNIAATLQAFDDAVQMIVEGDFEDDDLDEAKLEMIQNLDAPISPSSRADVAYSWYREGKTHAMRQAFRDRVLQMTRAEIQQACRDELAPRLASAAICAFASKELLEKENATLMNLAHPPLHIEKIWM